MDIEKLNILEVSRLVQDYIVDYFKGCQIQGLDKELFSENYSFDFIEIKHLIPVEYHAIYKDSDLFRGSSGYLSFDNKVGEFRDSTFIVMLITDEECSKALFLYVQEENDNTHEYRDILIADFLKNS